MTSDKSLTALAVPTFYGVLVFGQVLSARGWTVGLVVVGACLQVAGVLMILLILRRTGRRLSLFLTSKSATVRVSTIEGSVSFGAAGVLSGGSLPTTDQRVDALDARVTALEGNVGREIKEASNQFRTEAHHIAESFATEINGEIKRLTDTLSDIATVEDRLQKIAAWLVVVGVALSTAGSVLPLYVER